MSIECDRWARDIWRRNGARLAVMLAAGIGAGVLWLGAPSGPDRPNVVLVVVDTLRADALGVYGALAGTTPHIDRWAEQAAVFEGLAPAPLTIGSAPGILAGLYPSEHGYWNYDRRISDEVLTLGEAFATNGYRTYAISDNPHVTTHAGVLQGFESVDESLQWRDLGAAEVTDRFLEWLRAFSRNDDPYFALLWYVDPHTPLNVPPEAFARYVPEALRAVARSERVRTGLYVESPPTAEELMATRALYRAEVAQVDSAFGRLREALNETASQRPTLILLTSDHGEAHGENRDVNGGVIVGHGKELHETQLAVPLVMGGPGVPAGRYGRASLLDVFPTLASYARLDVAKESVPWWGRGQNLLASPFSENEAELAEPITTQYGPYVMSGVRIGDKWGVSIHRYGENVFEPPIREVRSQEGAVVPHETFEPFARALAEFRQSFSQQPHDSLQLAPLQQKELEESLRALGYIE